MAESPANGAAAAPNPQTPIARPKRRKRNLLIFTLLLLIIAGILGFFYLTEWRYQVNTEDAYVNGNQVQITAQIGGQVQRINVNDTDAVKAGDVLVVLDKANAELALEKAKADLASAVRQFNMQTAGISQANVGIAQARTAITEAQAQANAANVALQSAQNDYARRKRLAGSDAVSAEELAHARDAVKTAQAQVQAANAGLARAQAAVGTAEAQKRTAQTQAGNGTPLEQQPAVQAAETEIRSAWLNLQRTDIRAPVDGQIARRNVQLGQQIGPGTPLMAVVPLHDLWVDANFKESQLAALRVGQHVTLTSDIYGKDVVYHGIVQGFSAGTGSAFSVLPAQNATGNWIKVVQRVPVRIALDPAEIAKNPLRVGLTMRAEIDTRGQSNGKRLTEAATQQGAETAMAVNMQGAEEIIHDILTNAR